MKTLVKHKILLGFAPPAVHTISIYFNSPNNYRTPGKCHIEILSALRYITITGHYSNKSKFYFICGIFSSYSYVGVIIYVLHFLAWFAIFHINSCACSSFYLHNWYVCVCCCVCCLCLSRSKRPYWVYWPYNSKFNPLMATTENLTYNDICICQLLPACSNKFYIRQDNWTIY